MIDRVVLIARDLNVATERLTSLLGAKFTTLDYDEAEGCRIAIATDFGIEVIEAVLAASAPPRIRAWAESLGKRDLAIVEIVFRVSDIADARRRVLAAGITVAAELAYDSLEPLTMRDVRELVLDVHDLGIPIGLVQYREAPTREEFETC